MKKILNALFLTLLAVFTFSSCSDVPAPYDILGEGDVPGLTGDGTKENPYNIEAAQQKQDGSIAWVQGYIVGAIENVMTELLSLHCLPAGGRITKHISGQIQKNLCSMEFPGSGK